MLDLRASFESSQAVMPGRLRSVYRASALALLLLLGGWVTGRMLYSTSKDSGRVGHTAIAQAQLWYPTSASSSLAALKSRLWGWSDIPDAPLTTGEHALPILVYFGGWPGLGIDNVELIHGLAPRDSWSWPAAVRCPLNSP